ncbi:MAG: MFS transporter [Acetobacteraceae bacterium]|jgi:MFS transporter, ACS family, tartrate transporter
MNPTIEQATMKKVYWRILPLAMVVYFFCYLDRINVSFAALQMNHAIGLTAAAYGLSSTAFYLGYCLFEVPSNVILEKVGARIWIARIMITWGLASGATAFATGPTSFLIIRFLLGLAEAGLFPGIVLLFTYWFPDHHRARIVSGFTLALPVSVALGAPISTAILGLDGLLGYAGWKWIFLIEAVPTILIGIVVLFALTDKPAQAKWLNVAEKNWLITTLEGERRAVEAAGKYSLWQALVNPKILLLSLNYFGIVTASLGLLLFVPQIIKSLGATNMGTGYATMLAYICGAISMVVWGWISDRMGERRWNLFWACTLATVGLVIAGMTMGTWWSLAGMCIATAGFYGTKGPFWSMPSMMLTGVAAAAGIAWINSIGNVGGAVGPAMVGWIKDFTGSYAGGLYGLAAFTGVSALIAAFALHIPRRVPVRGSVEVPAE